MTVLTTERLILRQPRMGDLPECVAFWSSDRCHMMGGPWTAEVTATNLQEVIDLWALNGFGLFIVTLKGSDRAVGLIGPWQPEDYPEPELGWSLWDAALEGRGLALEAAVAARDWFFATTGRVTAVSYTHVDNHRSHRLCERMGAVWDPLAPSPSPPPERIYRHFAKGVAHV
jgi:RimJ/RimL family protein N-acetyltransferase